MHKRLMQKSDASKSYIIAWLEMGATQGNGQGSSGICGSPTKYLTNDSIE